MTTGHLERMAVFADDRRPLPRVVNLSGRSLVDRRLPTDIHHNSWMPMMLSSKNKSSNSSQRACDWYVIYHVIHLFSLISVCSTLLVTGLLLVQGAFVDHLAGSTAAVLLWVSMWSHLMTYLRRVKAVSHNRPPMDLLFIPVQLQSVQRHQLMARG